MKIITSSLLLLLCLSIGIHANTQKHSVADVMERHHGLSGPVFFVKANHLMANEKMTQSLGIHSKASRHNTARSQRLESADGATPYTSRKQGPSFSEVSEKHRSTFSHRQSDSFQSTQKRYTAFRLEDKATSI